jgi:hypothetical protein
VRLDPRFRQLWEETRPRVPWLQEILWQRPGTPAHAAGPQPSAPFACLWLGDVLVRQGPSVHSWPSISCHLEPPLTAVYRARAVVGASGDFGV